MACMAVGLLWRLHSGSNKTNNIPIEFKAHSTRGGYAGTVSQYNYKNKNQKPNK